MKKIYLMTFLCTNVFLIISAEKVINSEELLKEEKLYALFLSTPTFNHITHMIAPGNSTQENTDILHKQLYKSLKQGEKYGLFKEKKLKNTEEKNMLNAFISKSALIFEGQYRTLLDAAYAQQSLEKALLTFMQLPDISIYSALANMMYLPEELFTNNLSIQIEHNKKILYSLLNNAQLHNKIHKKLEKLKKIEEKINVLDFQKLNDFFFAQNATPAYFNINNSFFTNALLYVGLKKLPDEIYDTCTENLMHLVPSIAIKLENKEYDDNTTKNTSILEILNIKESLYDASFNVLASMFGIFRELYKLFTPFMPNNSAPRSLFNIPFLLGLSHYHDPINNKNYSGIPYFISKFYRKNHNGEDGTHIDINSLIYIIIKTFVDVSKLSRKIIDFTANNIVILEYKKLCSLLAKKIQLTEELMEIYSNNFMSHDYNCFEYRLCKKLFQNKNNHLYIDQLAFIKNTNNFLLYGLMEIMPFYFGTHYYKNFVDFFEISLHNLTSQTTSNSLFFDSIHRFLGYMDMINAIASLIKNNPEYSLPHIEKGSVTNFFNAKKLFNPLYSDTKNDIALGNGKPLFMLISAPTGAGKTALLRAIMLSLHTAKIGFVPAQEFIITPINNIFQNLSYIYNGQRGFSKQMAEDAYINNVLTITQNTNKNFIIILDEIYSGTTIDEAVRKFKENIQPLWNNNTNNKCIGIFSTHEEKIRNIILTQTKKITNYFLPVIFVPPSNFHFTRTLEENFDGKNEKDWWFNINKNIYAQKMHTLYTQWSEINQKKLINKTKLGEIN